MPAPRSGPRNPSARNGVSPLTGPVPTSRPADGRRRIADAPHDTIVPARAHRPVGAAIVLVLAAGPALACGGLIGPNGAVNLLRTTTFAGYHDGNEHYVTAFEFAGGGGAFGSLTPLPGIPSAVEKGGDWTLQRLRLETEPDEAVTFGARSAARPRGDPPRSSWRSPSMPST